MGKRVGEDGGEVEREGLGEVEEGERVGEVVGEGGGGKGGR